MLNTPDEIEDVVRRCRSGERPKFSVRRLLQWFGVTRRGASSTAQIALVLRAKGLVTTPDFSDAWIDEEIEFSLVGQISPPAERTSDAHASHSDPAVHTSTEHDVLVEPVVPVAPTAPTIEAIPAPPIATAPSAPPSTPPLTPAPSDSIGGYRFGSIDFESRREPLWVAKTEPLSVAISKMKLADAEVILVSNNGLFNVAGVITWYMVAQALSQRPAEAWTAGQCVDAFGRRTESVSCSTDDELLEVARRVRAEGYIVVRERNSRHFVVTSAELGAEFAQRLEPFLLATEIEAALRMIVNARLADDARALLASRGGTDDDREDGVRVTIGEALYLLANDERWTKAAIPHDRKSFVALLDRARQARNNVMHVNPEGAAEEHVTTLRQCARALRDVIKGMR